MDNSNSTKKIALIAFDDISIFHLSVPCLVFKDAFIGLNSQFELKICSISKHEVTTTSGFDVLLSHNANILNNADIIIVPSWPNSLPEPPSELIKALINAYQRGAMLVGLCLGAFIIAQTGLLDGKTATTHWGFAEKFKQRFPQVELDSQPLFIDHDRLITSAGTAASLDCCLHIVRRLCGSEVASQIARIMVTAPFRSGGQQQYIPTPIAPRPEHKTSLTRVIEQIELSLNQAHNIESVAKMCAMSRRTFTRRFKATYGSSFGQWLLNKRLTLSQQLLESSEHPIAHIAELAGFGSENIYRKHFKQAFRLSPSQWRKNFRG